MKALLFTRYAGYLSLFASGLYAAGFHNEKLGMAAAIALAISLGLRWPMPVNTGSFAATLETAGGLPWRSNSILVLIVAVFHRGGLSLRGAFDAGTECVLIKYTRIVRA